MKKSKLLLLALASLSLPIAGYSESGKAENHSDARISAIKLINTADNHSAFLTGSIPALEKIPAKQFWISNSTEDWEKNTHPAPRKQYVVTLKGKLKFKVSDGSTFIIAPGTVLLAEDIKGEGHSWEMIEGNEWVRAYIPIVDSNDYFTSDK
ncbi:MULTISPECIES: hypothetical protein [unclassified Brenneria]|uniref:hypothetical protein n=1 Tax=unclassified Brenneria TaxID=2634434 RepID=UPI0029C423FF|nr:MULTISPECIES: hypothetical protein [unclassified Brenneria]MDX5626652.1 hypothetical protein [Brenneria sp. L3-3Z]MDX5693998.1 hypothetical protein [Brenneria sp. L4-2C]MEE3661361.1 hypothetical protein [Brenneria sp. g21c3]